MPVYRLDPDGIGPNGNQWAVAGGGTANDAVKGTAVEGVSNGETAHRLNDKTLNDLGEFTFGTVTLAANERVTSVLLHGYVGQAAAGAAGTIGLYTGNTAKGGTFAIEGATAWRNVTYTGTLTQAELDDLRFRALVTTGHAINNLQVNEVYADLSTVYGSLLPTRGVARHTLLRR